MRNITLKQFVDQLLHFTWAFVAIMPIAIWGPTILAGALSGFVLACPREFVDQWPVGRWKDTAVDLLFFTLGGTAAGLVF